MNREKGLFFIVLAITLLWGGGELMSPYGYEKPKTGGALALEMPSFRQYGKMTEAEQRLVKLVSGWDGIGSVTVGEGRTIFVKYNPLLPVKPARLDPPDGLPTPVVLPPIDPFPPVPWYRNFRVSALRPVTGDPPEPEDGEVEEDDEIDEEEWERKILEDQKRWEFVPSAWDKVTLQNGTIYYGSISITEEARDRGLTKYHLLLPEHRTLKFYFERIDPSDGKAVGSGTTTLEIMKIASIEFTDDIESRYWSRRIEEQVQTDNPEDLLALGNWVLELADEERYVTRTGLELAVRTLKEAVAAGPARLTCTLALGEAYHRAFDYDEELRLYEAAIERNDAPSLRKRTARIYRCLLLPDREEAELTACAKLMTLDAEARVLRGEARYRQGKLDAAEEDFETVMRLGASDPENLARAREGLARVRVRQGKLEEAERMLAAATDAASLVTLGATLYAQRRFEEARNAFEGALGVEPGHVGAKTWLGFVKAHTATDWAGIEEALTLLTEAREAEGLNYYHPPLGMGFAEQRRGLPVKADGEPRQDQNTKSVDHYLTALKALPTEPYVHYIVGVSKARDGKYAEARAAFRDALKLDYRFVDALIWAGTVSMELVDWEKARVFLERALELESRELGAARAEEERKTARDAVVRLHYRLGRVALLSEDLEEKERWDLARDHFTAITRTRDGTPPLDKTFAPAHIGMAIVEYDSGNVQAAIDRLSDAKVYVRNPKWEDWGSLLTEVETKILTAEDRRVWQDGFDRQLSSGIGNGWEDRPLERVRPKIEDGEVVVRGGSQSRAGKIWLHRKDPDWPARLIRATTRVKVERDSVAEFMFILFSAPKKIRGQGTVNVYQAVGVGRNAIGQITIVEKISRASKMNPRVVVDEDDNPRLWSDGEEMALSITRAVNEHGEEGFDVFLDGEKLDFIEGGPGRSRGDSLRVGFIWDCNRLKKFRTSISMVEVEIDLGRRSD